MILTFVETLISFDMFLVNNEKYVSLLVNEFEWDWRCNDWLLKWNKLCQIEFST
jgi:hypothetical protein